MLVDRDGESRDLAASRPEVRARLAASLDAWNGELIDPVFAGAGNRPAKAKQKAQVQKGKGAKRSGNPAKRSGAVPTESRTLPTGGLTGFDPDELAAALGELPPEFKGLLDGK